MVPEEVVEKYDREMDKLFSDAVRFLITDLARSKSLYEMIGFVGTVSFLVFGTKKCCKMFDFYNSLFQVKVVLLRLFWAHMEGVSV